MLSNIAKALGFCEAFIKWQEGRPQRLKEKALEAAAYYIEISQCNTLNGQEVPEHRKERLLKHYAKQFYSWRDGV